MICSHSATVGILIWIEEVSEMLKRPMACHPELLIEVTVEELPCPIHAEERATHHRLKVVGVVGVLESSLVRLQFSTAF